MVVVVLISTVFVDANSNNNVSSMVMILTAVVVISTVFVDINSSNNIRSMNISVSLNVSNSQ